MQYERAQRATPATLVAGLVAAARSAQRGVTFIRGGSDEDFVSYGELLHRGTAVAASLRQQGVLPGDEVVLQLDDNRRFLELFWGALLTGAIPVPLTVGTGDEHRMKVFRVWRKLRRPHLAAPAAALSSLCEFGLHAGLSDEASALGRAAISLDEIAASDAAGELRQPRPEDVAFIQYSSGSTGIPKGVVLTHHGLVVNAMALNEATRTTADDAVVSWMPLTHDMGLIAVHLGAMLAGIDQHLMSPALFVRNPTLWMDKVHEHRATQLYSPNFGCSYLLRRLGPPSSHAWDLSSVRIIVNGAEPISVDLCARFVDALAPYRLDAHTMLPGYGLAEATVAVAVARVGAPLVPVSLTRDSVAVGCRVRPCSPGAGGITFLEIGEPVSGCSVRITTADAEPLPDGVVGHIQIRGENVTTGYYNDPEATAAVVTADGWLDTGDLGFLRDGRLVITGRTKDIIFANGQNLYPHDLERIAEAAIGSDTGGTAVCGVPDAQAGDDVVVFVVHKNPLEQFVPIAVSVRRALGEQVGIAVKAVVPVKTLPKTTSGKVQRYKLGEAYRSGKFGDALAALDGLLDRAGQAASAASAPRDAHEAAVLRVWRDALDDGAAGMESSFFDRGGSSLAALRLSAGLEREIGIEVAVADILRAATPRALAARLAARARAQLPEVERVAPADSDPVTSTQRRVFLLDQADGVDTAYNLPVALEITGEIDVERLRRALAALAARHEALRTAFAIRDGEIRQWVIDGAVPELAAERCTRAGLDDALQRFVRRFDLGRAPLVRTALFTLADREHVLAIDVHHIVCDGVSYELLLSELAALYAGRPMPAVPLQFRDYAAWLQHPSVVASLQEQGAYWAEALGGELPVMNMPCDFARPPRQTFHGDAVRVEIGGPTLAGLHRVARQADTTLFVVLLAAYGLVLSRYCGQDDLIVGTIAMARPRRVLREVMGMFANTLGLRLHIDRGRSFGELVADVRARVLDALAHQDYPFADLVDRAGGAHVQGRNPLFDTLLLMQEFDPAMDWGGPRAALRGIPQPKSLFDFRLEAVASPDRLVLHLEYRTDLFRAATMERMARRIDGVLHQIAAGPPALLSGISLLLDDEPAQLAAYNATAQDLPAATLHGLFAQQVVARAAHPAVELDGEVMSYAELDARASQVAHWLRAQGVERGDYVAVLAHRRPATVSALLGVLKAGAAYVPVDPEYPQDRQDYLVRHSGAKRVVGPEQLTAEALASYPAVFDAEDHPEDVAYVIYTSGSTGQPKGVVITHGAAANTVQDINARFGVTGDDRIVGLSSLCFDLSVYDVFGALAAGATLVQIPDQRDVPAVARVLIRDRITVWNSVPAIMDMVVDNVEPGWQSEALRVVMLSGDWIGLGLPGKVAQHFPGARCISLGGATEASIWSIYYPIEAVDPGWRSIPYGRPLANQTMYVLDDDRGPCPAGIEGEIYIGGIGVAAGYHADPEKTAAAFVEHPRYGRLYRTGDRGRFHLEGHIEFCGRKDAQVKIHGFRVELEEIENRLLRCPAVRAAKVVAEPAPGGGRTLCAYVVLAEGVQVHALHDALAASLPAYMVPSAFRCLDYMPLTANGKVDLRALPAAARPMENDDAGQPPADAIEARLLELWSEQLGVAIDGVNRRFLDLGGNSLAAAHQATAIQREFGAEIPFRMMFGNPSVREVAELICAARSSGVPAIEPAPAADCYPTSAAQRRVFVASELRGADVTYNMPGAFRLRGPLNHRALVDAFRALVARHDVLRTSFCVRREQVVQVVHPSASVDVPLLLSTERALPALLRAWVQPFDLGRPPLLRAALVRLDREDHVLAIDLHHIVSDGETVGILLDELDRLYRGDALPPPALQYRDYACWAQRFQDTDAYREQAAFWRRSLAAPPPALDLPVDHRRPSGLVRPGATVDFAASGALASQVAALAAATRSSPFMVLLAGFGALLRLWTGRDDLVIGLPGDGRTHPSVARLPGMFVNLLPVRTRPGLDKRFLDYLAEIKEAVLEAHEHQDYPFDELVKELALPRDASRNPLFDVAFSPQRTPGLGLALAGIPLEPVALHNGAAKFDLTLAAFADGGRLGFSLEYDAALFERSSIQDLADAYLTILLGALTDPGTRLAALGGPTGLAPVAPELESLTFAL